MLTFLEKIPYGTRRIRHIGFWLLTSFLLYTIIGFFVLPPVVKSIIIDQCSTALRRPTSIERVSFNPLTLRLEIHALAVNKLDGDGQFISVRELDASPSFSSIWNLAPVMSYLHLRDFTLDIEFFGNGKYSISDLIGSAPGEQSDMAQNGGGEEDTVEQIFPFALYGFEMTNATITFDDKPHGKKHVIQNMDLLVPFTSSFLNLRKEFTQPKFSAVINGDPITMTGRTLPFDKTLLTEFQLEATEIDLKQYWGYLPLDSSLILEKGTFTSNMSLYFERLQGKRLKLFLGGGGKLNDLELSSPRDGKVLALKELDFQMKRYSLGEHELILSNVRLDRPYFKLIRTEDDNINWAQYFPGSEITDQGAQMKTAGTDEAMSLDVKSAQVNEGILDWNDHAVAGGFKRVYPAFNFTCTELSNREDRKSVFKSSIGENAFISTEGTLTIKPIGVNATVTASNVQLPPYAPYLDTLLPVNVDAGLFSAGATVGFLLGNGVPSLSVTKGSLELNNVKVSKPGTQDPFFDTEKFSLKNIFFDLKSKTVSIDEARLTSPTTHLAKEKSGQIDIVRLFSEQINSDEQITLPSTSTSKEETPEWLATIKAVHMTNGKLSFKDLSLKTSTSISIHDVNMDAGNLSTRKGSTFTYSAKAGSDKHGTLELKGNASLEPLHTNGKLTIQKLSLRPFDGYLGNFTDLLFASGSASTNLAYQFKDGETPQFALSGDTMLHRIQFKDSHGRGELLGVDALKISGIKFSNNPYRLKVSEIHIQQPRASISFDENGYSNIQRALRIPPPTPVQKASKEAETKKSNGKRTDTSAQPPQVHPKTKPFFESLSISRIAMEDGELRFRDASVAPVYFTELTEMQLGLIDVQQAEDARPKLNFSAKIGPTPISATGEVNPLITPIFSKLTIAVNGMELVPMSPYTLLYLAYPIEKGRLYADVTFHTENWELNADNKFYVEQLVLGPKDKRPGAPNVPVKFGLSLLQDGDGNMELNLPIRGRLDDPNFQIGGIVFKTIASLFIKALASPFSLLGSIFGGSSENMDFVLFSPGKHTLSTDGTRKLDTTIKALMERKKLKLEVDGVTDPVSDKAGLIAVIFQNKLKQQKFETLSRKDRAQTTVEAMVIEPGEYEEMLFRAYKDEPDKNNLRPTTLFSVDHQPVQVMERFIIDRITINGEDFNELALRRANAVKEYIITHEPSLTDRVFLLDKRQKKTGKAGIPKHRVDMGIK